MVDFNKKIKNSSKFRKPAITFQKTGKYCNFTPSTSEYYQYWDEQKRRCIEGYTAEDGDWISGYNYFYLNFCPISRIVNKEVNGKIKRVNEIEFPDFWDYDYYYFQSVEEAEQQGKHLCVLKARRRGYSFKGGAMLCRNYYLIPNSKSFVYAGNKQYLTEDGILTKAWDYMNFIDKHTAWGKKRSVNTSMRKRAGFFTKDEFGNEIELGYKSEIQGVTLKDNASVVRGKKANLILFEEGGSMPELGAAWQIARPSVEVDGIAFAPMIVWGTGGDDDSRFATLKDMFYHPEGYNCLSFDNIWDEGAQGQKCGFFAPQYSNMDIRDDKGNRLYMDEDGNTLTKASIEYVLAERRKVIENATNNASIDRYVAERPITPAEAMLEFGGNIFPKKELQEHLARIRTNKELQNHKQVGDLVFDENGQIKWIPKKTGDITHYPLNKDDDPTGSIVIWEHPMQDAPVGLYILGVDPYDHDQSGTNSLGSTFVYKRFQGFESYYDIIVAEYTGRPASAEEYYENLRKLAIYYNGRIMYENERKGLFPYFTAKHCDYLLADQPDIISDVVGNSKVQRKKGCHMNKQIKQWGEGLIKDWLNEEQSPGKKNLYNILSEPLLQELIAYNDTGNFDRCLTKGTLVTTINGDKPVEEIDRTDKVLTHTGKYQNVTWTDKHVHNGNIVVLKCTGDYQELKCTDNHPILVKYTNYKKHKFRNLDYLNEDFLRADKLTNKYQFTLLPKRKLNNKLNISKRFLYLMGWMLSDGYCSPKSNEVKITFQKNQLECLKQCEQIIYEFDNSAKCVIKEEKGCYRLITYNKQLHDYAIRFGCQVNNKKLAYDVYNNYSDLMPFVLGILEGDGHQKLNANYDGYTRNCIEFSTVYEELLRQCRQILIDNGIYSSIRKIKSRNNRKTQYSLLISGEYVKKLLSYYTWDDDYNYEPIYSYKFVMPSVNKNTSKVLEDEHGFWVPIKLLHIYATTETVYNFEVQEDHTYVANGVLTHNCMALMQVMIYREQLYNVKVKEKEKDNKNRLLFDGPIFAQDWFDDRPTQSSDDNVYTF